MFSRSFTESIFPHVFLRGKLVGNTYLGRGLQRGGLGLSPGPIRLSLKKHRGKYRLDVNHIPKREILCLGCVCVSQNSYSTSTPKKN